MKAINKLIIILICFIFSFEAYAQAPSDSLKNGRQTEVQVPRFKLFPTTNIWIFLKIDTSNGIVKMVQYSMEDKNRQEFPINYFPLAWDEDAFPGRFNLYATQNKWTFLLLDVVDGRTWQVQWSLDDNDAIFPINVNPTL